MILRMVDIKNTLLTDVRPYLAKLFETRGFSSSGLLTIVYCKVCGLDLESHVKYDSIPVPFGNKVLPGWV